MFAEIRSLLISVSCAHQSPDSNQVHLKTGEECSKIAIDDPQVDLSSVTPEAVKTILKNNTPKFRCCYKAELDSSTQPQNLYGKTNLKFSVNSSGKATMSEPTGEELISQKIDTCLKHVLNEIQFPKTQEGKTYDVSQPLNFHRQKP